MKWPTRNKNKQTIVEEIFNAISHGVMIPVSIISFIIFCYTYKKFHISFLFFSLTMFMLYLMSCLYHSLSFSKAKNHFQRFDHICIYLLIWGSFTPFLLLPEGPNLFFFIFQSIFVFIGVMLKIFRMRKDKLLHLIIFLLLGWSGIFVIFSLKKHIHEEPSILIFLFLGGIFYSLGIIFYKNLYKKFYHFIWHLFVMLGNLFHVFAVYNFIKCLK
ncbi:hemolysin III [Candidatus Phytoplasma luffae]|uniref:Hemolysin III n=1 Tax=Loofah witches'-broom phytoplasma TaxID=35773 RepID=A0A975INP7_LOWBP|nr:hemolysin III family protein [Candidatus Phytoplasma luffae]QTX03126.1 hemolysin III [Candidatus Phytoplasma luffae]